MEQRPDGHHLRADRGRPKLTFALQTASVRTARDPDLHVKVWRDAIVTDFHIPGVQTSPMYKADYEIDRDEVGFVGWRSVQAGETTVLSSYEVAQREVKELLARRAPMRPR